MASTDVACRILTTSATLPLVWTLVHRIQNADGPVATLENGGQVPWTISNKYYKASVHFMGHTIHGLAPHLLQGVPAVIFVWTRGQAYKDHIVRLAQDLNGSEPEVSLAVMLPSSTADPEEEIEDVGEMDDFLSKHGFEFVDGEILQPGDNRQHEIPSFPRILDALSTIMWPSMQTSSPQSSRPRDRAFLNWAESSGSFDISDDDLVVKRPISAAANDLRARKQLDELARWLEEDSAEEKRRRSKADPWQSNDEGALVHSPTEMAFQSSGDDMKFDDDFTVFVSAPPLSPSASTLTPVVDSAHLTPSFAGPLYHSLGSQSDLGGDSDDELPTEDEIKESASQIFGTSDLPETFHFRDEGELAHFDLSKVFGVLQEMKAEIANMEDESERRRAAAKAALGFVYGLEREPAPNDSS